MGVPTRELGFGSGMTCWRRLAAWNEAGVGDRLHLVLLRKLRAARRGPKRSEPDRAEVAQDHAGRVDYQQWIAEHAEQFQWR